MDQLLPSHVDNVDPGALYLADLRQNDGDRPWVLSNMITSLDGAIAIEGVSGQLGGPADKQVFSAIRAVPDVILVGSGTVIAEDYRRPQTPVSVQEQRVERGQRPLPRIAIVSGSLSIDPGHGVFDPQARPIVITHAQAPTPKRQALSEVADVITAGEDTIDLALALKSLANDGANVVLLEGGPTLNAAMAAEDLVDEMNVSFAPRVVGGNGSRMLRGNHMHAPHNMVLDRALHQDGYLFLRYLRQTSR